ncbi:MAG: ATP-binding protein [Thalassotalea sp.]|nr:ATP-binding protein [Thalassotalea sp.]
MQQGKYNKNTEISALKQELDNAKKKEVRLKTLIESAPLCIHEINHQGQIISMNKAGLSMMNMENENEVCGLKYIDFVCSKQRQQIDDLLKKAFLGESSNFEFSPDNSPLILKSCFAPIVNSDGSIERVMGITEDITLQRQYEKEVSASEFKYRSIFNNADISILHEDMSCLKIFLDNLIREGVTDLNTFFEQNPDRITGLSSEVKLLSMNQAAHQIFDITTSQLQSEASVLINKLCDKEILKEKLLAIWNHQDVYRAEISLNLAKDREVHAIMAFRIPSELDGFEAVPVTFVDVTQQKRNEEELFKTRKLESIGLLAGGIAHDFNNILTGIYGHLQLAENKWTNDDSEAKRHLNTAHKSIDAARRLTNQLLTFAKGGDPFFELLDVREIIEECSSLCLSGTNVKNSLLLASQPCQIKADRGQISQVFTNIIINAVQSMPAGGKLSISVTNTNAPISNIHRISDQPMVKIDITDEGVGMNGKLQARVFDPYFTTKEHGTGLGLTTAYSIINKHKGYINIESTVGLGTTFSIFLPATTDIGNNNCDVQEYVDKKNKKNAKIMIMDDEEVIADLLEEMLSLLGHEVVKTHDYSSALSQYNVALTTGKPFDLAIMDLTIPGGHGGEQLVKEISRLTPDIKAIVTSGYSTGKVMSNPEKYGFNARLAKPFSLDSIKGLLNEIL